MNFTTFKALTQDQKVESLAYKLKESVLDPHLDNMVDDLGIAISEDERFVLCTLSMKLCVSQNLNSYCDQVPWDDTTEPSTWALETIHYFKKFMPYVFGYGTNDRPRRGLVALLRDGFADLTALDWFLIRSDFPNRTKRELIDHLNRQENSHGQFNERSIDNAIARHFSDIP